MYMPTVEHGDNLNSCGQEMNSSELSSKTTRNDNEFQCGNTEIAGHI
jgi:hypothetical protein